MYDNISWCDISLKSRIDAHPYDKHAGSKDHCDIVEDLLKESRDKMTAQSMTWSLPRSFLLPAICFHLSEFLVSFRQGKESPASWFFSLAFGCFVRVIVLALDYLSKNMPLYSFLYFAASLFLSFLLEPLLACSLLDWLIHLFPSFFVSC